MANIFNKKKRIGIVFSTLIMLFPLYLIIEYEYSNIKLRNDITNDLKILDIQLNDEFKFKNQISSPENKILGASKMVEIEISENDKLSIIKQIKNSKNFIKLKTKENINLEEHKIKVVDYTLNYGYNVNCACPEYFFNFKNPKYYSREVLTNIDNKQVEIDLQINLLGNLQYKILTNTTLSE